MCRFSPPFARTCLALASLSIAACAAPTQSAAAPQQAGAIPAAAPAPGRQASRPVSAPPPSPPPPPPPLTASDVLTKGRAPFDACYAAARTKKPDLSRTTVEMTFTMDDDGKLINVDFAYRNRMDDDAKDCMRKAAEAVTFPPSLRGTQTGTIVFTPP